VTSNLQILTSSKPVYQLLERPVLADFDHERFSSTHGAFRSFLMLKRKSVDGIVADILDRQLSLQLLASQKPAKSPEPSDADDKKQDRVRT
jgi:hypothetical protein